MKLDGRVAIVTGGASGFGRATALRFAREGARVVIADLDEKGGRETVRLVEEAGSKAELGVGDVSSLEVAQRAVSRAVERFGRLDVLVNNAGIAQRDARDSWDTSEETWDRVIRVNLRTVYTCSKAAIPAMLVRGQGSIVNVASIAASVCVGGSAYAATKGAILALTRHTAVELASRGIRVNAVSPGFMRTPMSTGERDGLTAAQQDERIAAFGELMPMRRAGSVDDIANAILYLASDEAGYVTGQEIIVDGGYVVRASSGPGPVRRGSAA
jgi:NAD(P)-dependent dehydrogenase (short-subunit alcohol dehydrogenase family)